METVVMKRCTKCGEEKPATKENFSGDASSKDGLVRQCKSCRSAHFRTYRTTRREELNQRTRQWREENAEHVKTYKRDYRSRNADVIAEHQRTHRAEYFRQYAQQYRLLNPDYHRQYNLRNPDKMLARVRNRRARLRNAEGKHTAEDVRRQFLSQEGKCHWCGVALVEHGKGKFNVDHVVPISKRGSNGPENLVCACPICNKQKSARTPWDFIGRLL